MRGYSAQDAALKVKASISALLLDMESFSPVEL